ncbi:DUF2182 domain-containing protein [Dictyobacter kobayashii]|uniref:DUF2182 domain-containing protein n=1 Tax=Dictyobacter kobayashii TaxID=2014872 RepID=A0A402AQ04_9CHLR|nr:DUF2182 domain-containing protein [Dictyobacter kobayashii]GCE21109.1 hypothetical protein KDK_49090 [Dictyobacter kobayashii]
MSLTPIRGAHQANTAGQNPGIAVSWHAFILPWLLLAASWGLLGIAFLTGHNAWLDHDYLIRASHWPWLLALLVFLLGWQVMLLAMMIPALFSQLLLLPHNDRRPYWPTQALFMAGYAASWTLFAGAAFVGDTLLHGLVNQWWWLYLHPQWIATLLFSVAGIFQWSPVKRLCLMHTRDNNQESTTTSWRQGYRYGLWCVGSNWALMLLMVGIGMRNLLMMAGLALLMWLEREFSVGNRLRFLTGGACMLCALLTLLAPTL